MSRKYKGRSSSPRNSKRGCLCRDGSYSRDCCDGEYFSQGVGSVTKTSTTRYYNITNCTSGEILKIHTNGIELTINSIYYLLFTINNNSGCYTVTSTRNNGSLEVYKATSYNNCNACISAN